LGYDAVSSGKKITTTPCLCNNPEERSSQLVRDGSLKSRKVD